MSPSPVLNIDKRATSRGFTLLEVLVAISILVFGMMALALLLARMYSTTTRSHFMNLAATFASEKLEDLEHYQPGDSNIAAGGSLTSLATDYNDVVGLSLSNGTYDEVEMKGASSYDVFTLYANGSTPSSQNVASFNTSTGMTFRRQWLIETNTPANGVSRLTVLVTLLDQTVQPPVTFQISAVRPCLVGTGGTVC